LEAQAIFLSLFTVCLLCRQNLLFVHLLTKKQTEVIRLQMDLTDLPIYVFVCVVKCATHGIYCSRVKPHVAVYIYTSLSHLPLYFCLLQLWLILFYRLFIPCKFVVIYQRGKNSKRECNKLLAPLLTSQIVWRFFQTNSSFQWIEREWKKIYSTFIQETATWDFWSRLFLSSNFKHQTLSKVNNFFSWLNRIVQQELSEVKSDTHWLAFIPHWISNLEGARSLISKNWFQLLRTNECSLAISMGGLGHRNDSRKPIHLRGWYFSCISR
jgi:hypothetical protein